MKYLELIKGQFTADHEARAKQLEPYVAYSEEAGGVMYTFIPEPVTGPADNEIWYTTTDGNTVYIGASYGFGASLVSNTYEDSKGVIKFDNSVTSIAGNAFYNRSSLTSVTIPNSVTTIKLSAFYGCTSLTSIVIPDGVTSIEQYAFNKSSLASIIIPNGVTSIGLSAFGSCTFLTSVTIPNSVTSIGNYVFANCTCLTSITYEGTQAQWNAITKEDEWNLNVPATYVQCSDGQVAL